MKLRGLLLAGGTGSRLLPLTEVTNKHLLPVGNRPMIEWPLRTIIEAGVDEIMVVTGKEHSGAVFQYLGSGKKWGVDLTFRVQDQAGGIAQAIALAEGFAHDQPLMVLLGDNIFQMSVRSQAQRFTKAAWGALLMVTKSTHPEDFGVVEMERGKVVRLVEKPKKPKSNLVQTGCYFYDASVFDRIHNLKPSKRGELEVTDLNSDYLKDGRLQCEEVTGWWTDAGSPETLRKAGQLVGGR